MKRLGFLVNPIAGMGGAVGLKGTDGEAYLEALKLGAEPVTPERARSFLSHIENRDEIFIISAPGVMGDKLVEESQIQYSVSGSPDSGKTTSAEDTKRSVGEMMKENIDILVRARNYSLLHLCSYIKIIITPDEVCVGPDETIEVTLNRKIISFLRVFC